MSHKLDKPYTDKDRTDFIFKYNQDCFQEGYNCRIEESETALYALEENEILMDDEVIIDPQWEEKEAEKRKQERNAEIDSKIKELNEMSIPEMLNNNIENLRVYREVISGLEAARPL